MSHLKVITFKYHCSLLPLKFEHPLNLSKLVHHIKQACTMTYAQKHPQTQHALINYNILKYHVFAMQVRTPIGTIVDIELHRWGPTMNIDIYMSAKDMGNSDGLCGYFDGDPTNDFIGRDGQTSTGNNDYVFSDSWRFI